MRPCPPPRRPGARAPLAAGLMLSILFGAVPLGAQEAPLSPGETIRLQVESRAAWNLGLDSPMEGVFLMVLEDALVASSPYYGRLAVPLSAVEALEVQRARKRSHVFVRGGIVGGAFGVGMWQFLKILCRSGCDNGLGSAWLPAAVSGLFVGALVAGQGPGTHWVPAELPPPQPGSSGTSPERRP